MPYLLDTSTISILLRDPQGRIAQRIANVGVAQVCTSSIVTAELHYGVLKKGSAILMAAVDGLLQNLTVHLFGPPADWAYGWVRTELEKRGQLIGDRDMMIAAHALSMKCVVVTDNIRDFSRVPSLLCENWSRP